MPISYASARTVPPPRSTELWRKGLTESHFIPPSWYGSPQVQRGDEANNTLPTGPNPGSESVLRRTLAERVEFERTIRIVVLSLTINAHGHGVFSIYFRDFASRCPMRSPPPLLKGFDPPWGRRATRGTCAGERRQRERNDGTCERRPAQ